MNTKKKRRLKVVRTVGMTAAAPVLAFTLCPIADEPKQTDNSPVKSVGTLVINGVSSGVAQSRLFIIPTPHGYEPERESGFHFSMSAGVIGSGQVGDVPFVSIPDGSDMTRRRTQWMLDADPMLAAVIWFASTQAKKP